ncbi:MAG: substrate-binding domain-containing protein [Thioalkalivibrio sp.]|nr:substrate-binding domain-containing protein [Thioalkalivibrio sp.]
MSRCIGIVIGHGVDFTFTNPLLGEVLRGVGQAVAVGGYQLILLTQDGADTAKQLVRHGQVDGLIFMSAGLHDPVVAALATSDFPFVLTCKHTDPEIAFVDVDNRKGAELATRHLLALGHRRIAFINGPLDHGSCRDRLTGYRAALEEVGVAYDPLLVAEGDFSDESGFRKAYSLLQGAQRPTAIFASSDLMAIGALRAVHDAKLEVPKDVSIVGFDGIPMSRFLNPPLTTVRQAAVAKGKLAADMLLQRLAGSVVRPHQVLLEPELVVRATTTAPAVEVAA